jgi:glucokinase
MVILAGDIGGAKTNLGLFVQGKTRPLARVIINEKAALLGAARYALEGTAN